MISVDARVKRNWFPQIAARFPNEVDSIMGAGIIRVSDASVPFTPVETGELVGSRQIVHMGVGFWRLVWHAGHAGFVHNGTIYQTPNPYARRAYDQEAPQTIRELSNLESRLV